MQHDGKLQSVLNAGHSISCVAKPSRNRYPVYAGICCLELMPLSPLTGSVALVHRSCIGNCSYLDRFFGLKIYFDLPLIKTSSVFTCSGMF
jgi:hypothetical protein